ncbi:MAG: universal stress protein [Nitrospiraceae bacterium]
MKTTLVRQILSATDFSESALKAQDYAVFLAQAYEAKLQVVHVSETPLWFRPSAPASLYLEQAREEAAQQLVQLEKHLVESGLAGAQCRLVLGIPSEQINAQAREMAADLVVVGTHGRTGLDHILLGSTAERVVKGAPCPVVVARIARSRSPEVGAGSRPVPSMQRIVVPLDFSSPSLDAAEYAIQTANRFGAAITLLHVLEPVYYDLELGFGKIEQESRTRQHWQDRLGELAGLVRSFGLAAEAQVRGGVPADSIVACAEDQDADLIVMGTHGRRGWSRLRFGSVAEAVLRQAPCSVLTVKTPKFEPGHRRVLPQAVE